MLQRAPFYNHIFNRIAAYQKLTLSHYVCLVSTFFVTFPVLGANFKDEMLQS
jgi:hypothetical protein